MPEEFHHTWTGLDYKALGDQVIEYFENVPLQIRENLSDCLKSTTKENLHGKLFINLFP